MRIIKYFLLSVLLSSAFSATLLLTDLVSSFDHWKDEDGLPYSSTEHCLGEQYLDLGQTNSVKKIYTLDQAYQDFTVTIDIISTDIYSYAHYADVSLNGQSTSIRSKELETKRLTTACGSNYYDYYHEYQHYFKLSEATKTLSLEVSPHFSDGYMLIRNVRIYEGNAIKKSSVSFLAWLIPLIIVIIAIIVISVFLKRKRDRERRAKVNAKSTYPEVCDDACSDVVLQNNSINNNLDAKSPQQPVLQPVIQPIVIPVVQPVYIQQPVIEQQVNQQPVVQQPVYYEQFGGNM